MRDLGAVRTALVTFPRLFIRYLPRLAAGKGGEVLVEVGEGRFLVSRALRAYVDALFTLGETWLHNDYYRPSFPVGRVDTVVDLGAYIGDFTVWSCYHFDPARIIALEPSATLYELLCRNVALNGCAGRVTAVRKAIYARPSRLRVQGTMPSLGFVSEHPAGEVEGITLRELMAVYELEVVDLFKMDIEGGERYVLTEENAPLFRDRVRYAVVEAHDLRGNRKEDSVVFFRRLGFRVKYREIVWLFGIYRVEAMNPSL